MNWGAALALVAKDLNLFFRDRFFAFITVLGLVFYAGAYLLMPETVDESIGLGLYAPAMPETMLDQLEEEGEPIFLANSEGELQAAVLAGDIAAGIAFPEDLIDTWMAGQQPAVTIYLPSDAPEEMPEMAAVLVEAMLLTMREIPIRFEVNEVVLGPDLVGQQIPTRDRMLPLFAIMVLMMETLGLASLIAQEIQAGTIHAILATPLGVGDLLISKTITSLLLTFSQAVLLMLIMRGFQHQPLIILLALLLGSLLVTGIGFLMGSAGKDMLSVMGTGMLVMILLFIPAIGVIFPGLFTGWVRLVPSFYLAETIHLVANLGAGWQETWQNLIVLLGISAALLWLGAIILKRRVT